MKRTIITASMIATVMLSSHALAETAPRGWVTTGDGPKHEVTGLVCPKELGGFEYATVAVDGDAAMLGRCHYPGNGPESEAWLRVREYHKGSGESGMAVQIDETLMNPKPGEDAPAAGWRVTPGTASDGRNYSDMVITSRVGDLLVDCIGRSYDSGGKTDEAVMAFVTECSDLVDEAR